MSSGAGLPARGEIVMLPFRSGATGFSTRVSLLRHGTRRCAPDGNSQVVQQLDDELCQVIRLDANTPVPVSEFTCLYPFIHVVHERAMTECRPTRAVLALLARRQADSRRRTSWPSVAVDCAESLTALRPVPSRMASAPDSARVAGGTRTALIGARARVSRTN